MAIKVARLEEEKNSAIGKRCKNSSVTLSREMGKFYFLVCTGTQYKIYVEQKKPLEPF